ncbi:MAG: fibronectin type III domain-containing protein [Actinomycetia bacterium]|nr:fibronectin type III domain-containing protein [Actinomycetes bacterium]
MAGSGSPCRHDLRYRETGTDDWAVVGAWASGTLASSITGLEPNTSYQVQVLARNGEGNGGWSGTGSGTTGSEL